jgi:hypothetical protein
VGQALAPREAVALADFRAVGDVVDGVDVRAGKIEDELFPVVSWGQRGMWSPDIARCQLRAEPLIRGFSLRGCREDVLSPQDALTRHEHEVHL